MLEMFTSGSLYTPFPQRDDRPQEAGSRQALPAVLGERLLPHHPRSVGSGTLSQAAPYFRIQNLSADGSMIFFFLFTFCTHVHFISTTLNQFII